MQAVNEYSPYFLYIEDDDEDVELLKYALSGTQFDFDIVHKINGEDACAYLDQIRGYKRLPDVIFLDVNMSKLNGKETLVCLKADMDLAKTPIVVLSTSSLESDMRYFAKHHIPYIIKPGDIKQYKEDLVDVLKGLLAFEYNFKSSRKNTDAA